MMAMLQLTVSNPRIALAGKKAFSSVFALLKNVGLESGGAVLGLFVNMNGACDATVRSSIGATISFYRAMHYVHNALLLS